jgi:hypothetical protein
MSGVPKRAREVAVPLICQSMRLGANHGQAGSNPNVRFADRTPMGRSLSPRSTANSRFVFGFSIILNILILVNRDAKDHTRSLADHTPRIREQRQRANAQSGSNLRPAIPQQSQVGVPYKNSYEQADFDDRLWLATSTQAAMFPITANIRLLCRLQSTFFVSGRRPLVHRLSFHGSCPTAASISFSSTELRWWSVLGPNFSLPIFLPVRISSARGVIRDMCQMFWVSPRRSCLTNPCLFVTYGAAQRLLGLRASLRNRLFRQECRRWRQP